MITKITIPKDIFLQFKNKEEFHSFCFGCQRTLFVRNSENTTGCSADGVEK
jgi:hypothetical protein